MAQTLRMKLRQLSCNPDSSATRVINRDEAQLLAVLISNAREVCRHGSRLSFVDLANSITAIDEHTCDAGI